MLPCLTVHACLPAALGSAASELELSDLWLSLAVDCDILAGSKQAKPLMGEGERMQSTATNSARAAAVCEASPGQLSSLLHCTALHSNTALLRS